MNDVGVAAAFGRTPPESAIRRLGQLSRTAPLSVEPLLVQAAIAQRDSDLDRAERLLVEARRRDPRSAAARYLLAETWIRKGRIGDGLEEMSKLARLMPGSAAQLAPTLSEYARIPGAQPQIKRILAANPQLRQPILNVLAEDPDNARLILELGGLTMRQAGARPSIWQAKLLRGLVDRRDYDGAYALWQRFSGLSGRRPLLFNGDFRQAGAPPPFNWSLASGAAGLAEAADGRLRVLHYGREDATLASQLLLLPPGRYRLSMPVSGSIASGALAWVVTCSPGNEALLRAPLTAGSALLASFTVPAAGCPAQSLELRAAGNDMPGESDLLLGPVVLERAGG